MAIKYKTLFEELKKSLPEYMRQGKVKLPSESELCKTYDVSRQTVRGALLLLSQEGLIEKKHGSGTYITGRLAESHFNRIAILISNTLHYIFPEVLSDIHSVLSASGFTDEVFETKNRISTERSILIHLLKNPPRGMIVEACQSILPNPNIDLYRALQNKGCHITFLYSYYSQLDNYSVVKDDNYNGSAMLVDLLHSYGKRTIGGIFQADVLQGTERYQGYVESIIKYDLTFSDNHICWFSKESLANLETLQDTGFLKHIVERLSGCDSVICFNDEIAYWLVKELTLAGYNLPSDIAICAFDNTYLSNQGLLSLTTLSHLPHEMGTKAANSILNRIKGLPAEFVEVPWILTQKSSTTA